MTLFVTYNEQTGDLLQFAEDEHCATAPFVACNEEVRTRFNKGIYTDKVKEGKLIDISTTPEYAEAQKLEREIWWNKNFFKTTIGWIRRQVNMADGSQANFLDSFLPLIITNFQFKALDAENKPQIINLPIPASSFLYYEQPNFDNELTAEYVLTLQKGNALTTVTETGQFIAECQAEKVKGFRG